LSGEYRHVIDDRHLDGRLVLNEDESFVLRFHKPNGTMEVCRGVWKSRAILHYKYLVKQFESCEINGRSMAYKESSSEEIMLDKNRIRLCVGGCEIEWYEQKLE